MRDIRPLYSFGLPLLSIVFCLMVALVNPAAYRSHIRKHEVGLLEHGTVLCLVPAAVLGVAAWRRRRELPARWLGAWVILLTLGAAYFAGEECSWGQNYFRWGTPHSWSKINDQNETNLHNTSGLFDHAPRALLSLAAGVGAVIPIVLLRRQRQWDPRTKVLSWILPTTAVVPCAIIALLVGLPQKLHGKYEKTGQVESGFSEMFLNGRHSELKEYFLAMFILMYVWSFFRRLQTMDQSTALGREPEATGISPRAMQVTQSNRPAVAA